jgi:hypothetical protein
MRNAFLLENLEGRHHSEDQAINEITLKWILKKYGGYGLNSSGSGWGPVTRLVNMVMNIWGIKKEGNFLSN